MNAVEIEQAVSALAEAPFDPREFPWEFLRAFGNNDTTIRRLRSGKSNKSDTGGVLQRNNIHLAVCGRGEVSATFAALKASPATAREKVKFVLATDGETVEAEEMASGETVICRLPDFPNHFGVFLELGGITTVKQLHESSFDIRATSRLNKLYVELLKDNPTWGSSQRSTDMNHFMARLIFCFFAEDTDIFGTTAIFTSTFETMSAKDSSNTHDVISELFRAMNTTTSERESAGVARWACALPYVNGGLFSGSTEVPRFSKIARAYLLNIGKLDWKQINPDIFGSMIQAIADEDERGSLGMHYTSVPNILKVLNPLFLDELRSKLRAAGDNPRTLLNLRKRIARVRVFDPACGSGNFLVIAYRELRAIEATINERRKEPGRKTEIPLTNFYGIELREFPAEVARLALIIAEYQCDVRHRGQKEALAEVLPLDAENWIRCGNALLLDWFSICPPSGEAPKRRAQALLQTGTEQSQVDFENEGGETYICGNPPYRGSKLQTEQQKADLEAAFRGSTKDSKSLDYVAGWFFKAAEYGSATTASTAFVATNSICQGLQVPLLWPLLFATGHEISFAHTSFKWSNLAAHNAGVTVVIVGLSRAPGPQRRLTSISDQGEIVERSVGHINAYLVPGAVTIVEQTRTAPSRDRQMLFGNMPRDGGHFILGSEERERLLKSAPELDRFVRPYFGSEEMIQGRHRWCIWIGDDEVDAARAHPVLSKVLQAVADFRNASSAGSTRDFARLPYRFVQIAGTAINYSLVVAKVSSERRQYLPVDLLPGRAIVSDLLFAMYDAPLWNLALIASRLHLVWIATVCGKMKTDFRYSNTLGWNTFPVPRLTENNKDDLTRCAEEILLARARHFPATIADLYEPGEMPADLRDAHARNDETLERIYIGRRFRNDTERLEKLFEMYAQMKPSHAPLPKSVRKPKVAT